MAVVNSSKFNFKEDVDHVLSGLYHITVEAMQESIQEVAKESARKLRQESPKRQGQYAKGWAYKMDQKRLTIGATVYGKDGTYQLAHLLEHGHAKRGGGRTKSIVHIKPVEEWAIDEVYDRMITKMERSTL